MIPPRIALLRDLRDADPEGRPWPPTEQERAAFRAWVIRTHGQAVWEHYLSGWDS